MEEGVGQWAADTLLELLCDAVRLRLISDVPLGAFLSGGLDSSVVVAVAAGRLGARIPTFNISFPGYADYDEAHHARRVADHFGCKHHEIPVDSSHFEDLGAVVWALAHFYSFRSWIWCAIGNF